MRTNIDIDEHLIKAAMQATGKTTKKETVEEALRLVVERRHAHEELMKLYGTVQWEGDLDEMRRTRHVFDGK